MSDTVGPVLPPTPDKRTTHRRKTHRGRRKTRVFHGFTLASINKCHKNKHISVKDKRWVLKNMDAILSERITMRSENSVSRDLELGPFVFNVNLRKYGLPNVAIMHIKPLLKNVCRHAPKHRGVALFERFLRQELDVHTHLDFVLDVIEFCHPCTW